MKLLRLLLITSFYSYVVVGQSTNDVDRGPDINQIMSKNNLSDSNKDMYVVHAMVYQVGIITNKTEDELNRTGVLGNQEAVTFYHTNGSGIDLSSIPEPLLTNVTAQSIVGVAPVHTGAPVSAPALAPLPWAQLSNFTSQHSNDPVEPRQRRDATTDYNYEHELPDERQYIDDDSEWMYKRSLQSKNMEAEQEKGTPVRIVSGAAVIPQDAGVQSIAIPPLLTLNNNFSEIPVPIPNTSVVHYAKVNTLVQNVP